MKAVCDAHDFEPLQHKEEPNRHLALRSGSPASHAGTRTAMFLQPTSKGDSRYCNNCSPTTGTTGMDSARKAGRTLTVPPSYILAALKTKEPSNDTSQALKGHLHCADSRALQVTSALHCTYQVQKQLLIERQKWSLKSY